MSKQRVLVTAGASGISRAVAEAFAAAGADVFVCDINQPGLDALAQVVPGPGSATCRSGPTSSGW